MGRDRGAARSVRSFARTRLSQFAGTISRDEPAHTRRAQMSQADLATRLNEAIALINAGRRAEGRAILISLSQQYPTLEQIWLWIAASSETTEDRIAALRRVLSINPRNEKARAALTQLTGEALPVESPPPAAKPRSLAQTIESYLLAVLAIAALIAVFLVIGTVAGPLLTPKPTATATYTPSLTFTPSMTFTASVTPGGPTFTPIFQTLPPSWTPSPTPSPGPTRTPPPTFTPLATFTPTTKPTARPTLTRAPTYTAVGPSVTPTTAPTQAATSAQP